MGIEYFTGVPGHTHLDGLLLCELAVQKRESPPVHTCLKVSKAFRDIFFTRDEANEVETSTSLTTHQRSNSRQYCFIGRTLETSKAWKENSNSLNHSSMISWEYDCCLRSLAEDS